MRLSFIHSQLRNKEQNLSSQHKKEQLILLLIGHCQKFYVALFQKVLWVCYISLSAFAIQKNLKKRARLKVERIRFIIGEVY